MTEFKRQHSAVNRGLRFPGGMCSPLRAASDAGSRPTQTPDQWSGWVRRERPDRIRYLLGRATKGIQGNDCRGAADRAGVVQRSTGSPVDDGVNLQRRGVFEHTLRTTIILRGLRVDCCRSVARTQRAIVSGCARTGGSSEFAGTTTVRSRSEVLTFAARGRRQRLGSGRS